MCRNKFKKLKSYADAQLSKYFPSVRPAVLLIVIPAFFIVIAYFFNTVTGIATGKDYPAILEYENRLASIKKDLPLTAVVNYISNSNKQKDLINAAYVLIPVRVVAGLKPRHDLLIYQSFNTAEKPNFKGYTLKKDYGNGVILFKRNK
ncbi:MAG: hypothetical protein GY850_02420 [bacterium]|nr:hypothetical protein [bacterium]